MCNNLGKKGDRMLSNLVKQIPKVESGIVMVEKKTGMPSKFKVPKPIIPSIKFKKGVFNGNTRRII